MNSIPYVIGGGILAAYTLSYVPCGVFKPCTEIEGRNDVEKQRFAYDCPICSSSEYQYWLCLESSYHFRSDFSYSRAARISGHSVLFVILLPIDIVAFVYLVYQTIGKKKIKQGDFTDCTWRD